MQPMWGSDRLVESRSAMTDKFIPSGDTLFLGKAENFARKVSSNAEYFEVSRDDADALARVVEDFGRKLQAAKNKFTRSKQILWQKDQARDKTKRVMERLGRLIRANDKFTDSDRISLGMTQRPTKLKKSECPQTRPELFYEGARHGKRVGRKVHVLRFKEARAHFYDDETKKSNAKPAGARGVELFVELIEEHEEIPKHPGELSGGR